MVLAIARPTSGAAAPCPRDDVEQRTGCTARTPCAVRYSTAVPRITDRNTARGRAAEIARSIASTHRSVIETVRGSDEALAMLSVQLERARKKLRRELGPELSAQALLEDAMRDVVAQAIARRLAQEVEAEDRDAVKEDAYRGARSRAEKLRPPEPKPEPPPKPPAPATPEVVDPSIRPIRIVGFAFVGFAAILALVAIWENGEASKRRALAADVATRYRQTTCTIRSVSSRSTRTSSFYVYEYDLTVDGRRIEGDRYSPNIDAPRSALSVRVGQTTPCFYDPANPTSVFLSRGSTDGGDEWWLAWVALGIAAFGGWIALAARHIANAED